MSEGIEIAASLNEDLLKIKAGQNTQAQRIIRLTFMWFKKLLNISCSIALIKSMLRAAYKEMNAQLPIKNDAVKDRLVPLFSEQIESLGCALSVVYDESLFQIGSSFVRTQRLIIQCLRI